LKKLKKKDEQLKKTRPAPRGDNRILEYVDLFVGSDERVPSNFASINHLKSVLTAYASLRTPTKMADFRRSPIYRDHTEGKKLGADDIFMSEL